MITTEIRENIFRIPISWKIVCSIVTLSASDLSKITSNHTGSSRNVRSTCVSCKYHPVSTKYSVAADCTEDIERTRKKTGNSERWESFRGKMSGVMTPVVNIRRPTVDWGVNLQLNVVYNMCTCSPINACTHIHAHIQSSRATVIYFNQDQSIYWLRYWVLIKSEQSGCSQSWHFDFWTLFLA